MLQTKEKYCLIDRKRVYMIKRRFSYLERWEMISQKNRDCHLLDVVVFNIQKYFAILSNAKNVSMNTFLTSKNFHMKRKHNMNKGSYKCKKCEKKFLNPFALSNHLKFKKCVSHTNNKTLLNERRKLLKSNNELQRQIDKLKSAGVVLTKGLITMGK